MIDLKQIKEEYQELLTKLTDPELISRWEEFQSLSKRRSTLEKIMQVAQDLEETKQKIQENLEIISSPEDPELSSLAQTELEALKDREGALQKELEQQLKKGTQSTPGAVILEIRAGTGGEEAALFAFDLFTMYRKYANQQGWKDTILDQNLTEQGGLKEGSIEFEGETVFENLQYEGGVHRVQRIPATEKAGRIHTSTASVAMLPKPTKTELQINPSDLKIETTTSSGPGGQNVNKRQTAVRVVYIPTGLMVVSQISRNQQKNKDFAIALISAKILAQKREEEQKKLSSDRKAQIGWAKRAEKIRTYNFPQDRITDHRIEKSWHGLEKILGGELSPIVQALQEYREKHSLTP
ncbi:MAG: peptide chain release factor 1 [Candidatus Wildermuthbacteria bacterium RIFCSPHIGHO2_02_FULL_47_12]|uniref:Peptide chain release factor 1 n=1 Tax=Candidatus Wildermuthbacteria bacterium RIFCSPHIGHO2_02_FULL_47_12 TaxID=1802451 RepID=A0A1G2R2F6_9BACT|nr:MAG: peptide chain release factor 1 [Candidatus Wildermuthbacteria bacterium RIFCSPHIGHO2_02_FULL_47_12]